MREMGVEWDGWMDGGMDRNGMEMWVCVMIPMQYERIQKFL